MTHPISRRTALRNVVTGSAAAAALSIAPAAQAAPLKGRIKQSVCRWCYRKIPLEELCKALLEALGIFALTETAMKGQSNHQTVV